MSKFDPYDHLKVSLNSDGSLTRHTTTSTTAATGESPQISGHAVLSKDVTLNAHKKTWMRIYLPAKLPSNDNTVARLPIIFYFHGGGWIRTSIADSTVHQCSNLTAAEVPSILIAVEFRLAPENRLPAPYEDATDAVRWVINQADDVDGDQWIRDYADFSRCYLYGADCGANIAFHAAVHGPETNHLRPLKIAGLVMSQPLFGGQGRTKSELEMACDEYFPLPVQDLLWELALPVGADRDHRFSNPFNSDGEMREKVKKIGRCLVIGCSGDPLIERQQDLVKMLAQEGVSVETHFDEGGFHDIDMVDSRKATTILNIIKAFV